MLRITGKVLVLLLFMWICKSTLKHILTLHALMYHQHEFQKIMLKVCIIFMWTFNSASNKDKVIDLYETLDCSLRPWAFQENPFIKNKSIRKNSNKM